MNMVRHSFGTKAGCISDKTKYWSDNKVYYTFADDFTGKDKVLKAIKEWEQKTSLTFIHGTAIHEIGHAIGLIHEQCRNDRDSYINI